MHTFLYGLFSFRANRLTAVLHPCGKLRFPPKVPADVRGFENLDGNRTDWFA